MIKAKDMSRAEVISELRKYFHLAELVCPHTLARDGERSWRHLTTDALRVLLALRVEVLKVPLICNTSKHTQRGLRCNLCDLVKQATASGRVYLTTHNGRGFDLTSREMTAEEMRRKVEANADAFPCPVRIEKDVTWLHIDTMDEGNGVSVYRFNG